MYHTPAIERFKQVVGMKPVASHQVKPADTDVIIVNAMQELITRVEQLENENLRRKLS